MQQTHLEVNTSNTREQSLGLSNTENQKPSTPSEDSTRCLAIGSSQRQDRVTGATELALWKPQTTPKQVPETQCDPGSSARAGARSRRGRATTVRPPRQPAVSGAALGLLDSAHARASLPGLAPIPELPGTSGARPQPGPCRAVEPRAEVPVAARQLPGSGGRAAERGLRAPGPRSGVWSPPSPSRPPGARAAPRPFTSQLLPFPSRSAALHTCSPRRAHA